MSTPNSVSSSPRKRFTNQPYNRVSANQRTSEDFVSVTPPACLPQPSSEGHRNYFSAYANANACNITGAAASGQAQVTQQNAAPSPPAQSHQQKPQVVRIEPPVPTYAKQMQDDLYLWPKNQIFYKFPQPRYPIHPYLTAKVPFIRLPTERTATWLFWWCNKERTNRGLIPSPCSYYTRLVVRGGDKLMTPIQIKWIVESVTGAYDVKVVDAPGAHKNGVFLIDVHPWDASRVIRELSKRVILDEEGFYMWNTTREKTICGLYAQTKEMCERVYDNNNNIVNKDSVLAADGKTIRILDGAWNTPLRIKDKDGNVNSFKFPDHPDPARRTDFTAPFLKYIRENCSVRCRPHSFLTVNLAHDEKKKAVDRFCPCDVCRRFFAGKCDLQFCLPDPSSNNNNSAPPKPVDYDSRVMDFQKEFFWPAFYYCWDAWDRDIPLQKHKDPHVPDRRRTMPSHSNQMTSTPVQLGTLINVCKTNTNTL